MKKLYRVEITKTLTTEIIVFAENKDSATSIAEDIELDFDYCEGDCDYYVNEINENNKLDKSEIDEIPFSSEDEYRTCKEILESGDITPEKWIPPKSQLGLQF